MLSFRMLEPREEGGGLHHCEACGVDCRSTAHLYTHMRQQNERCLRELGLSFSEFKSSFRAKQKRERRQGPMGDAERRRDRLSVSPDLQFSLLSI
jgi:hypothetical protein